MPNPAIQRLIAAGASPARAKAFADQLVARAPQVGSTAVPNVANIGVPQIANAQPELAPMPKVESLGMPKVATPVVPSIKVQGPGEWYSDDYAAASSSWAAGKGLPGYQVPEVNTPEFTQYYEFVNGPGSYSKFESKVLAQYAPSFSKAMRSTNLFDKSVAAAIKQGKSLTEIFELITTKPIATTLTVDQQNAAATKLFNEYNDAVGKTQEYFGKIDKNYRYSLPDPKFKYGATTNFQTGTVDVLNNYWANSKYRAYEQQLKAGNYSPTQIAQALSTAKTQLATALTNKGITPFKDETARRDALKKGK